MNNNFNFYFMNKNKELKSNLDSIHENIDSIYFLPSNLLEDLLEIKLSGIKRKRK
jgi:predicted nucleotidyltransferase